MTKEQIAKLAKEAGFTDADENSVWITDGFWTLELERFAHLVYEATFRDANIAASRTILDAAVLEEREACAKVCEKSAKTMEAEPYRLASDPRTLRELVIQSLVRVITDPNSKPGQITAAAKVLGTVTEVAAFTQSQ